MGYKVYKESWFYDNSWYESMRSYRNQKTKEDNPDVEVLEIEDTDIGNGTGDNYNLTLFNDDYHTYDYVIDCLMKVCGHHYEQAFQCTLTVDQRGKCIIKNGEKDVLIEMCGKLTEFGLIAEVKKN